MAGVRPDGPPGGGAIRSLTIGIVLGVTVVAFESLAVVTIAPRLAQDLGGIGLYGWLFSGFLLASLVGIVAGGHLADTGSLARPLALSLGAFGLGLVIAGAAASMSVVIVGRVLQGLGGGALNAVMLTAIIRAYPDSQRARMMALASSAWVVPSLMGPAVAGFVAEALHWRWVFWGILPLLVGVAAITVPTFGQLRPAVIVRPPVRSLSMALLLACGTGLVQAGLGGGEPWHALLALAGAAAALFGLRELMPVGFLRLAPGAGALVAARGLTNATAVGVEAFLALTLTTVLGYTSTVTGGVVAVGSIGWAVGAWLQARLDERFRARRGLWLNVGAWTMAAGLLGQFAALYRFSWPLTVVIAAWFVVGLGAGMAHSMASVSALFLAPEGKEGRVSSSLAISDQWAAAMCTGIAGSLLALAARLAWSQEEGIALASGFVLAVGALALVAARRGRGRPTTEGQEG